MRFLIAAYGVTHIIAQFCASMQPTAWTPPPMHVRELQALVQLLAALLQMERQEQNRFSTAAPVIQPSIKAVLATIKTEIKAVERMIRDHIDRHPDLKDQSNLLDSILGVGVAIISRLSKKSNATIRKALYMPAVVARRYNPTIKEFAQRLKKAGKSNMLIIGAVMRKLLHIIYGVLKSGKPFDANYAVKNA